MAPSSKVLVFGAGAVGAVYSYIFTKAVGNKNVTAVCRSNYEAAVKNGFTINSTKFGKGIVARPNIARTVDEAAKKGFGPFDYAVICSKALPTAPSTAQLIRPAIGPSTTIVLVQNGIAIEKEFAEMYPENPLLSCVVYCPASQVEPGVIEHKEIELLQIGTHPPNAPEEHKKAAESFAKVIEAGDATAKLYDDIQSERWTKLLVNATWNPLCALTRSRDVEFLRSVPGGLDYVRDLMKEVASVAQASGYPDINDDKVQFQIDRALARDLPGVKVSMLADALEDRNMEVEAIVGNLLGIAKEKGIPTPLLRGLYMLVKGLDESISRKRQS